MSVKIDVSGKNLIITTDTIDNSVIYKLKTEHLIFHAKKENDFKFNFNVTLEYWTPFVNQLKWHQIVFDCKWIRFARRLQPYRYTRWC